MIINLDKDVNKLSYNIPIGKLLALSKILKDDENSKVFKFIMHVQD